MSIQDFKEQNKVNSELPLKDGRALLTTENGFNFWVADKKGRVSRITEEHYNLSKQHRITKRIGRQQKN